MDVISERETAAEELCAAGCIGSRRLQRIDERLDSVEQVLASLGTSEYATPMSLVAQVEKLRAQLDGDVPGPRLAELHAPAGLAIGAIDSAAAGLLPLDAPVSGGVGGAAAGTLTFMVGGPEAGFAKAAPLFEVMGQKAVHAAYPAL